MAGATGTATSPVPLHLWSRRRGLSWSRRLAVSRRTRCEVGTARAASGLEGRAGSPGEVLAVAVESPVVAPEARHCRSNSAGGVLHLGSCSSPWL